MVFRVLGFRVQGLRFRVSWILGLWGFRVQGSGFRAFGFVTCLGSLAFGG